MSGERASSTRQRESGQRCHQCRSSIPIDPAKPWPPLQASYGPGRSSAERLCASCELNQPRHRVLMNFMLRDGWHISFLEADCRTSLSRKLNFADPDKIIDMARRGGAELTSAFRCDLERAIGKGRGGIWLNLTAEQYRRLK